ncbi:MAG TPA: T9SS type A sorting domain-containing protein [Brumimicrobium sp.]|nr:T9SS type A sorting domain-containing protein [Brumimicrobium sp.]
MKRMFTYLLVMMLTFAPYIVDSQTFEYQQEWGTYFGDRDIQLGDNAIDLEGNIYFVGSVKSTSIFTSTNDSHQPNYGGGETDGFIVKISPQGNVLWSTYLGGNKTDYITGITIDNNNNLYILGITSSSNNIATSNSFQSTIDGASDYFVAKFSNSGTRDWGTYISNGHIGDTNELSEIPMELASFGNSIISDESFIFFNTKTTNVNMATQGVFQDTIGQSQNDLISKFSFDGERVWSTYYGINKSNIYSIEVADSALYIAGQTQDLPPSGSYNTYFGTPGSFRETPYNSAGVQDVFISKFNKDGGRIWSTYYGNSSQDYIAKNSLIASDNAIYLSGVNLQKKDITTSGSFQDSTTNDMTPYLVKFNADGERLWCTFIGLNPEQEYNTNGSPLGAKYYSMLSKDSLGNIYISGSTIYRDNISTTNAFQSTKKDIHRDLYIAIFNPSGENLYGSYFGGELRDNSAKALIYDNILYLSGTTESQTGITTPDAYQVNINNQGYYLHGVPFLAKFTLPIETDTTNSITEIKYDQDLGLVSYPNPNNGTFTISSKQNIKGYSIYTLQGKLITSKNLETQILTEIEISSLQNGVYFVKINFEHNQAKAIKVLVN